MDAMWPGMDERSKYVELVEHFPRGKAHKLGITLKEASFMKLFCDAYFLKEIRPNILKKRLGDPKD